LLLEKILRPTLIEILFKITWDFRGFWGILRDFRGCLKAPYSWTIITMTGLTGSLASIQD
jgi:hypothetical protein